MQFYSGFESGLSINTTSGLLTEITGSVAKWAKTSNRFCLISASSNSENVGAEIVAVVGSLVVVGVVGTVGFRR